MITEEQAKRLKFGDKVYHSTWEGADRKCEVFTVAEEGYTLCSNGILSGNGWLVWVRGFDGGYAVIADTRVDEWYLPEDCKGLR